MKFGPLSVFAPEGRPVFAENNAAALTLPSSRRNCSTSLSNLLENGQKPASQASKIEKKLPFGTTGNRNLYSGSNHRI
jgi:hypothetical protein